LTLEQSRHFDCGSKSRSIYPDAEKRPAGMPTLEEVFIRFKDDKRIRYFIETKLPKAGAPGRPVDTTLYAAKVDQLVRKYGLEDRVVLQSFDWRTLSAMHELNPRIRTCPLGVPRNSHDYAQTLRELHATCIVLETYETTPAQVRQFQKDGVLVFSGVIDTEAEWREAVDLGYDAIFTNDPVGVIRFLRGASLRRCFPVQSTERGQDALPIPRQARPGRPAASRVRRVRPRAGAAGPADLHRRAPPELRVRGRQAWPADPAPAWHRAPGRLRRPRDQREPDA